MHERICEPTLVGNIMKKIWDKLEASGGVMMNDDFVFILRESGTIVYPRAEYDKIIADANNNPNE